MADSIPPPSDSTPAPTPSTSTSASLPALPTDAAAPPPLSKKAQKRLIKAERQAAERPLRRAREREMKKEKEKEKKRLIKEGLMEAPPSKRVKLEQKGIKHGARREPFGCNLVIDLGFDDLMVEKEIKSMASQLGFVYAANRATSVPVHLLMTSWNKRLKERMIQVGREVCLKWRDIEWWEEGYEELWQNEEGASGASEAKDGEPTTIPSAPATTTPPLVSLGHLQSTPRLRVPKSNVIYLTGDSPNVLTELSPSHTYIIGGIVDHNRYKSLCHNKAIEQGIQHAQLPIGEYLPQLKTRKVLTVNQVVEIMVKWTETRDWEKALTEVMPTRKLGGKEKEDGKSLSGAEDLGDEEEGAAESRGDAEETTQTAEEEQEDVKGPLAGAASAETESAAFDATVDAAEAENLQV